LIKFEQCARHHRLATVSSANLRALMGARLGRVCVNRFDAAVISTAAVAIVLPYAIIVNSSKVILAAGCALARPGAPASISAMPRFCGMVAAGVPPRPATTSSWVPSLGSCRSTPRVLRWCLVYLPTLKRCSRVERARHLRQILRLLVVTHECWRRSDWAFAFR
jgi:hypothetical protein